MARAGVVPAVGECEAAGMAQHMRMDGEGEGCRHPDHGQLLAKAGGSHRRTSLGGEQVGRGGLLALQAKRAYCSWPLHGRLRIR